MIWIVSFGGIVVGVALGVGEWLWRKAPRYYDVPRPVEIPVPVMRCVNCQTNLYDPHTPPFQLYLELWDAHGGQLMKWPVGPGERAGTILEGTREADQMLHELWAQVGVITARRQNRERN